MSQPPRTTYRHGDTRGAALRHARDGALPSLRATAKYIGVTHGALFRHFHNADAFADALAEQGFHTLAEDLAGGEGWPGLARAYVRFATAEPALYALMMSRGNAAFAPGGALRDAFEALLAIVRTAVGQKTPDTYISDLALQRFWITAHGAVSLHTNGILAPMHPDALAAFIEVSLKS